MKNFSKISIVVTLTTAFTLGIIATFAATTPALNMADTFGILSSTYTNTVVWTTINGNIWYTTAPAMAPTLNGTLRVVNPTYSQAGINQSSVLADLNSQWCTFSFAPWAIDLATDATHGPIWVYGSWVYCITGAASIWVWWINLNWTGTYIFRITWALTTVVGSSITVSNWASACDVFWTPTQATTFATNTTFKWNIIDNAGITMWANSTLLWRALAYGWTITTDTNTITVPTCIIPPIPATLHIIKNVINGTSWTWISSDFTLHVKYSSGVEVAWSPALWTAAPGTSYSLSAGNYLVSENINTSYTQSFSWDCSSSGSILLSSGDNKTCIVTNTFIPTPISSGWGGGSWAWNKIDYCPTWDYSYSYYDWICNAAIIIKSIETPIVVDFSWITIINTESTGTTLTKTILPITKIPIVPVIKKRLTVPPSNILPTIPPSTPTISNSGSIENVVPKTPGFPNTGIYSEDNNNTRNIIIVIAILTLISASIALIYGKQKN